MFKKLIILFIFLSQSTLFASPKHDAYLVEIYSGKNWNPFKDYSDQLGVNDHDRFLRKIYKRFKIIEFSSQASDKSFFIVQKLNEKQIEYILKKSPAVKNKVLNYKISSISIN